MPIGSYYCCTRLRSWILRTVPILGLPVAFALYCAADTSDTWQPPAAAAQTRRLPAISPEGESVAAEESSEPAVRIGLLPSFRVELEKKAFEYALPAMRRLPPVSSNRVAEIVEPALEGPQRSAIVGIATPQVGSGGAEILTQPGPFGFAQAPPTGTIQLGQPWWQDAIGRPLRGGEQVEHVDLNDLILAALANSPRVLAINDQPMIEETAIVEAAAAFDPKSFLESKYVSQSDPVGNTLTTGGPTRFRQQDYQLSAGVRKKSAGGGSLEFGQKIGKLHNNSVFLSPPEQGNARLSLSFTQPMLKGGGQIYNSSLIVLAEIDTRIAADQAASQIQDHLLEVAQAYGTLQLQRAALLQKRRLTEQAEAILEELEARQELDAMQSQIARARAAVAFRRVQLVRCETEILNAETRLRNLIGKRTFGRMGSPEMVPLLAGQVEPLTVSLEDSFVTAVRHRPELDEVIKQSRATVVRVGMAANEMLSTLDFVLESYIAGLAPNYQTGNAFMDQFTEGQPGFNIGFVYDAPWGNRAARAKLQRRELEARQAMHHFRDTLSTLLTEVEIAVREIETTRREMEGHWQAMQAANTDIQFMEERWRFLPGDDGRRSFLLEDLLRAQERLAAAEYEFANAQFQYSMAISEWKRATGTLLQRDVVNEALPDASWLLQ